VAALGGGREDLARAAAEEIAGFEAERAPSEKARAVFAAEIARLRRAVATATGRVGELERGRRVARAAEAARQLRKGRTETTSLNENSLAEAERTLERLRERQGEAEAADAALDELDGAARSASLAERLADEVFGPRLRPSAADVLARLKARSAQGNPPTTA
jgi:phage shock protein A